MKTAPISSSTTRSRRFRERVAEMGYRRMEITADIATITGLRAVAKARKIDTWDALAQAVKLLVQWHNSSIAGNK